MTVYLLIQTKWLCTLQSKRCDIMWVNHRQLAATGSHHWTCCLLLDDVYDSLLSRRARAVKNALHVQFPWPGARPWFHATFALPLFSLSTRESDDVCLPWYLRPLSVQHKWWIDSCLFLMETYLQLTVSQLLTSGDKSTSMTRQEDNRADSGHHQADSVVEPGRIQTRPWERSEATPSPCKIWQAWFKLPTFH